MDLKEKNPPKCPKCDSVLDYWWECPKGHGKPRDVAREMSELSDMLDAKQNIDQFIASQEG